MSMPIEPEREASLPLSGDDGPARGAGPARRPKAPYTPPSLTRYGTVRELTKGGSGTSADGANHTHK
jgi:hypothetical protein